MDLINNRYRVIKNLSGDRTKSSYLVSDKVNYNEILQLNILNSEFVSISSIEFFIHEFTSFTSIDNSNIVKVFEFGLIYSIDNKQLKNNEYFYTNNYCENNMKFEDLISEINEDNIIDIFLQICIALNYLHIRGFIYGELNITSLIIHKENGKYKIMLKDLPTLELQKYDYWSEEIEGPNFKAPEIMLNNKKDIVSDIYSLGVLLLSIVEADIKGNSYLYNNLISIAEKMTQQEVINRYGSISEIVNDINRIFNKQYKEYNRNEIEKLNFNTKIIGRNLEISSILKAYDNISSKKTVKKSVFVHGEQGIGKTRLLKEMEHIFSMRKIDVYSSFSLENSNSNRAIVEILRKIVLRCGDETLKMYQRELIKFIPELEGVNDFKTPEKLTGEKEKYRLISRIYSFILEFIGNKPTIFIVDNADYLDDFSIEFLEYFNAQTVKEKDIMVILSYNHGEHMGNYKFHQFINKNSDCLNIYLNCLNSEETAAMVQGILSMPWVPIKFSIRIYDKTYGNPLFIEETLKDLLSKKIIYIKENSGAWYATFDNFEEIPISSTMEQALLSQIKDISEESYKILSNMAIFNTAVSVGVLEKLYWYKEKEIGTYINDLCSKGILCKKIEDRGFAFDFNNKVLKNLIYNKLSEEERKDKHENVAFALENLLKGEGRENKEELIYHLEKAGDKNKVVKYCIENAERMEKFKITDEAINNYEKALNLLTDEKNGSKKVGLLLKIGDIYAGIGNLPMALENYEKVDKYASSLLMPNFQVDALNKIADVYFKKNEIGKVLKYIKSCENILITMDYIEGYLENRRIFANVCNLNQEYEMCFEICTSTIKLCEGDHTRYKGFMYNILGKMYSETSRTEEALEKYKQGLKCFQEINYSSGVVTALNGIGVIYGDYYGDNESSISYFMKMKEISEKNNFVDSEILALTNLANCYLEDFKYDVSLQCFKVALEKSKKIEYELVTFYCYNYLSFITLKMGNKKESYEYYSLAEKELKEYPIHGRYISIYYEMGAELYYALGDMNKAYSLIQKALEIYNNDGSTQYNDCKLLLITLEIYRAPNKESIEKYIEEIKILKDLYTTDICKINILYEISILLCECGYMEEATGLFQEYNLNKDYGFIDFIKLKGLYLNGLISKGNDKITHLDKALDLSKQLKNKTMQWKICTAIGDYYLAKRDYFYGANYYFEACEIIKYTTLQLPIDLRVKFINIYGMIKPFEKINEMKKMYSHGKVLNPQKNKILILNNKDLDKIFSYDNFGDILNNKQFIKSTKNIYSSILPKGIHDINDVIMNMCDDSIVMLDTITKLLSSMVLSTQNLILIEDQNKDYSIISSSHGKKEISEIKIILDRVKETKNFVLINDRSKNEFNYMPEEIKAIMCIPIFTKKYCYRENDRIRNKEKSNSKSHKGNIKGYLYMESERVLNNFNEGSLKKCMELNKFIGFILETYGLKITSSIDKLTGVLTRKFLEEALTYQLEKANQFKEVFTILMLDLDNFKEVNDRFGHQTGDHVLKEIGKVLIESIRKEDICGRFGGEEFIVILPGTDTSLGNEIAERIRLNIENRKILKDKRDITISVGIATFPIHAKWRQELVEKVDQALYIAKESGKNRCQVWEERFSGKVKSINKLSGIVSGNVVGDSRNVLAMVELIELTKEESNLEDKIYKLLGRIIEITEAENGLFFILNENKVHKVFGRKIFEEDWVKVKNYSEKILDSVIIEKQGTCIIDWDDIPGYDLVSGMPNWNSVLTVPLINSGIVKGVLSLTVPIKVKEFKFEDLNFVNILGQLVVAIL